MTGPAPPDPGEKNGKNAKSQRTYFFEDLSILPEKRRISHNIP